MPDGRLDELLHAYLDEVLDEAGRAELEDRLRTSESARRRFVAMTRLDEALGTHFRRAAAGALPPVLEALPARPAAAAAAGAARPGPFGRAFDHAWGPAAAVLAHAALVLILLRVVVFRPAADPARDVAVTLRPPETLRLEEAPADMEPLRGAGSGAEPPAVPAPAAPSRPADLPVADRLANRILPLYETEPAARWPAGPLPRAFASRGAGAAALEASRRLGPYAQEVTRARRLGRARLAALQRPDGTWPGDGTDGLALLALLAGPDNGAGTADRAALSLGLRRLAAHPPFGARSGGPGDRRRAVAVAAFSEAYAVTRLPALRPLAERGAAAMLADAAGPAPAPVPSLDELVWRADALLAARLAGLQVAGLDAALQDIVAAVKTRYDPAGSLYVPPPRGERDELAGPANRASLLFRLGHGASPEARRALAELERACRAGRAAEPGTGRRAVFRAAEALFAAGGASWTGHGVPLLAGLAAGQTASGGWPAGTHADDGEGEVYRTALATLALSVTSRYPPGALAGRADAAGTPAPLLLLALAGGPAR